MYAGLNSKPKSHSCGQSIAREICEEPVKSPSKDAHKKAFIQERG